MINLFCFVYSDISFQLQSLSLIFVGKHHPLYFKFLGASPPVITLALCCFMCPL